MNDDDFDLPEYAQSLERLLSGGFITPDLLSNLPTLEVGHDSDLKLEGPWRRVWLSRMTPDDGEAHRVYVERWNDRTLRWHSTGYFPFTGD